FSEGNMRGHFFRLHPKRNALSSIAFHIFAPFVLAASALCFRSSKFEQLACQFSGMGLFLFSASALNEGRE
ncbi:MAG: hypothetical protein ACREQ3_14375, partial [Candidatus Binatia bacterium]